MDYGPYLPELAERSPARDPAGPDVLEMPDGTWLLYHDSTTDASEYGHGIRVVRLTSSSVN